MLVAGNAAAAPARFETTRSPSRPLSLSSASSHSVDSIIQRLILSKQQHRVVVLSLPAYGWLSLRSNQQRGLVAAAVEALRPDGTFVMRLTDVPPKWDGLPRWRQGVEDSAVRDEKDLPGATLSLGVACYTPILAKPEDLVEAADAALLEAKRSYRNQVVVVEG